MPDPKQAPTIAAELIDDEGVVLVDELDGGLGAIGAARVVEAVGDLVPVGAVMFGAESLAGAAAFAARYSG